MTPPKKQEKNRSEESESEDDDAFMNLLNNRGKKMAVQAPNIEEERADKKYRGWKDMQIIQRVQ